MSEGTASSLEEVEFGGETESVRPTRVVMCCVGQHSNHDSPRSTNSITSTLDELFSHEATLITECASGSYNTAAILHYCRRKIIKPRDIIFSLVGYRGWRKDGADLCLCAQMFSVLYLAIFLALLCSGPILQYNICLRRDIGISTHSQKLQNASGSVEHHPHEVCSGSLMFVYIIPSTVFVLSYLVTCLMLRCGESEHLQTLLERVYLISTCSTWEVVKQRRLGCVWLAWIGSGLLCLALSLTSLCLYVFFNPHISFMFLQPQDKINKILLCVGTVALLWLGDVVVVIGVLLYCAQCHLLSTLNKIIRTTLIQGAITLQSAKKQIDESSRFLRHLNQELGTSVGLYLALVFFRAVTSFCHIYTIMKTYQLPQTLMESRRGLQLNSSGFLSREKADVEWVYVAAMLTNFVPWLLLTILPLFMAARLSCSYRALSKVGCQLHARPFGYLSTPQPDIDSFLIYVSSLKLKAKILWIPVRTYFLVAILVLSAVLALILSYLYY